MFITRFDPKTMRIPVFRFGAFFFFFKKGGLSLTNSNPSW